MIERAIFDVLDLEYRAKGRRLSGRFPYNSTATISDRGAVRKERFGPKAFSFAIDDLERDISLLGGHSFNVPLAVRTAKNPKALELEDTDGALYFAATLPPESQQPTSMKDVLLNIQNGLIRGVSPGFRVPPAGVLPDAETFVPEPGNPGVEIRVINAAVLYELSLVHRPSYKDTSVELRHGEPVEHVKQDDQLTRRVMIWL